MNLTIYSIFRNSASYIPRYLAQIESIRPLFDNVAGMWLTGDNDDSTEELLSKAKLPHNIIVEHTGQPYYPSRSMPERWRHLERLWNKNIQREHSDGLALVVESDLIWDRPLIERLMSILQTTEGITAVYPMLWKIGLKGQLFYDTNGFSRKGLHFKNLHPFIPDDTNEPFVQVDTGGGVILTHEKHLAHAEWRKSCVLHFPSDSILILDKESHAFHP